MAVSAFGKAFRAARKAGKKEFSFGGKKYNTKMKGEGDVPKPTPRPDSGAARSTKGKVSAKSGASRSTEGKVKPKSSAAKPQQGPVAAKAVGIAKAGSRMSRAKAKEANAPKSREAASYPRPAKQVGIAKPGSRISRAAARRENAPKKS